MTIYHFSIELIGIIGIGNFTKGINFKIQT